MVMRGEKAAAAAVNASIFSHIVGKRVKLAAAQMGEGSFLGKTPCTLMISAAYLMVWLTCFWCSIWWPSISDDSGSPDSPDLILRLSNKTANEPAFSSL